MAEVVAVVKSTGLPEVAIPAGLFLSCYLGTNPSNPSIITHADPTLQATQPNHSHAKLPPGHEVA